MGIIIKLSQKCVIQNGMSMMVKKIMESDDTLKVAVIKYEIDIIEMREVKGQVIMTENYPDLVVDQGERTTTRTKRIPKTEDEAEEEEEVDGLLARGPEQQLPRHLLLQKHQIHHLGKIMT